MHKYIYIYIDVDNAVQSEKKYETHDEFKMILKDHQKVLKWVKHFFFNTHYFNGY